MAELAPCNSLDRINGSYREAFLSVDVSHDYEQLRPSSPLAGLRVVEFTHFIAGPLVGRLLMEQGAEVIRVTRPNTGDQSKGSYWSINRDKQHECLDLKSSRGLAAAKELVAGADILIENFRPGVLERLGLGYDALSAINPTLIYLSLPGFSSADVGRRELQGWEGILNAAACVFTETSAVRQRLGFPPVYTPIPQCSTQAAAHGVVAVMAALKKRRQSGHGVFIEVPLFEAGLSPFSSYMGATKPIERDGDKHELDACSFAVTDTETECLAKLEAGRRLLQYGPFYGQHFKCGDGRLLLIWAQDNPKFVDRLFDQLGMHRDMRQLGLVNDGPWKSFTSTNISNGKSLSPRHAEQVRSLIEQKLRSQSALAWERQLQEAGVPVAAVRSREEWLSCEAMLSNQVLEIAQRSGEDFVVPGPVVSAMSPVMDGPGSLPIDTAFAAARAREATPNNALSIGSPIPDGKGDLLSDLKVLDMTGMLAGPNASYVLSQFGADVIRVDPAKLVHPEIIPAMLELNQGKRSVILDFDNPKYVRVLERLIRWADVIIHNRIGASKEKFGTRGEQVARINPRAVVVELSAFGGSKPGIWDCWRGFDPIAQAVSGLTVEYGTAGCPQSHGSINVDLLTGTLAAYAALVGVEQAELSGGFALTSTSLVRAVNFLQYPAMSTDPEAVTAKNAGGQFTMGPSWYHRIFECADGWIFVGATLSSSHRLSELTGCSRTSVGRFGEQTVEYWKKELRREGIAAHKVCSLDDYRVLERIEVGNSAQSVERHASPQLHMRPHHPCGHGVTLMDPSQATIGKGHCYFRPVPAERVGKSSEGVLLELGFSSSECAKLFEGGGVLKFLPALENEDSYFFSYTHREGA